MSTVHTIDSLLLDRLDQLGLKHIFGVPGEYVLTLYKLIEVSPIEHLGRPVNMAPGLRLMPMRGSME